MRRRDRTGGGVVGRQNGAGFGASLLQTLLRDLVKLQRLQSGLRLGVRNRNPRKRRCQVPPAGSQNPFVPSTTTTTTNGCDMDSSEDGTMNTQPSSQTEPDPDTIKMFVGQIPRAMDENDLKKMFEEYGPVYQLNVLRDKVTGQSKGCCFVTFFTRKAALDAQNELHNMKTMPGMHHPIQMKPADSEKRNEERKLFVGMISKKLNENDIRMMFSQYGSIEDCTVLRDQNGQSRGCAFVTFANRQSAQNAIKSMHHSTTMEGCSSPLVVKFADTQKEKEAKKMQQMTANLWNMSLGPLGALAPQYLAQLLQQAAASGNMGAFSNLQNMGQNVGGQNMGNLGNLGGLGLQQLMAAAAASSNNPGLLAALASASLNSNQSSLGASNGSMNSGAGANPSGGTGDQQNNVQMQNLQGIAALASLANNPATLSALGVQNVSALNQLVSAATSNSQGNQQVGMEQTYGNQDSNRSGSNNPLNQLANLQNLTSNNMSGMGGLNSNSMNGLGSTGNTSGMDALSQAYSGIQSYAASFPNAFNTGSQLQQSANSAAGKQTEGPDGANLFIYHLPQEFGDQDLMQMFMPFGNVVSAKVFIDKQTNLSKCFGFVSYDNPVSAQAAIQAMNGFQIGMKRLKVQLKRPKNDSKPY